MARKKKVDDGPKGSPAWMSTFSDLMNLLLCFFVLLFSMSSVNEEAYARMAASFKSSISIFDGGEPSLDNGQLISSGASQLNNLDEYYTDVGKASESDEVPEGDPMMEYRKKLEEKTEQTADEIAEDIRKTQLGDYVSLGVSEDYTYVRISINGGVLFDSGNAELKEEVLPILSRVGDILLSYEDRRIVIEGHTDNVPISNSRFKNNMELSWHRANSVWNYMTGVKKLNPKLIESSGRGEYDPVASNKTETGKAKNRRVEFKIYSDIN